MVALRVVADAAPVFTGAAVDASVVAALRRADETAIAELVELYTPRLKGMCWRYLHDEHLVEDVVQETFLRMLESLPRVRDELNVSAWLHRIATNLCLDELRRHARASRWQDDGDEDHDARLFAVQDSDRARQPECAFDDGVVREQFRAAARRLPERQWAVLASDLSDVSQADTASALGISVSAVQAILFRARERFRAEYVEIAGADVMSPECAAVAFTLEIVPLSSMRLDRLKALRRHLGQCPQCHLRFGRLLDRAGSEQDEAIAV